MNHLSPLWTIWYKPRATVRQGLERPSPVLEMIVAAFFGVSAFLDRAENENYGDDWSLGWIFALAFTVGPLVGVLSLYLMSTLLGWTGKLFRGRASFSQLRTAVAHGWIPFIWLGVLQALLIVLYGKAAFTFEETSGVGDFAFLKGLLVGLLPIWILLAVWMVVIAVLCIAEAQGFSAWAALANYALSFMVMIVAAVVIAIVLVSVVALVDG